MNAALGVNWFDLVALVMVGVGVFVGRKRGMSSELLDVIQWLLIIFASALACDPFGRALADITGFSPLSMFVMAYLLTAGLIKLIFVIVKRMAGEKLVGSDVFGNFEYYLGMAAGGIRFACITLFALALLNAKPVTDAQLAAQVKYQNDNLGSVYFPPFGSIQRSVFRESFTGKLVKDYLSAQLINVDPSAGSGVSRENIGQARKREVEDVIRK
ncbi:MAG TPA: CvpA family protein [Verrucomicrobiae bacterium]|nr:CvpA family protein [Verrucomicrobiae bacterium]